MEILSDVIHITAAFPSKTSIVGAQELIFYTRHRVKEVRYMTCPKCEEGVLEQIYFKKRKETGYICDFCGATWIPGENIAANTGHLIYFSTKDDDTEYTFVDADEDRKDKQSRFYPKYK